MAHINMPNASPLIESETKRIQCVREKEKKDRAKAE
jgi:hypothetical protein